MPTPKSVGSPATTLSELIKTNAPMHIIQARMTEEAALRHRCPFCRADAGQPCLSRTSGQEVWPHMRRISLTRPAEERRPAPQMDALCCVCGNLRAVSSDYRRYQDPEHAEGEQGKAGGWRKTQALKCDACGERTRHALIAPADARWGDTDERLQRIALGGKDPDFNWSDEYLTRMRAEYFAKFPRNPKLAHRYWIADADDRREQGETHMKALCGADMEIPSAGSGKSKSKRSAYALVEPERIDWDTEFEDPETGLWWVDMECVDCLRRANEHRQEAAKKEAERLVEWYVRNVKVLNHSEVEELIAFLQPAAKATYERWQQEKNQADSKKG